LAAKAQAEAAKQPVGEAEQRRLQEVEAAIALGQFERALRRYEQQPWQQEADPEARLRRHAALSRDVLNAFTLVLGEANNERLAQLRASWPTLAPVQVAGIDLLRAELAQAEEVVTQTALTTRLDLMNERAQVTDAWRQVAVAANALLGTFN